MKARRNAGVCLAMTELSLDGERGIDDDDDDDDSIYKQETFLRPRTLCGRIAALLPCSSSQLACISRRTPCTQSVSMRTES